MLSPELPHEPGALFSDIRLAGCDTVVAAVSGGGDSLALLLLLHDHLEHLSGAPALLAVTVDHGLRPGSGEEARAVGRLAAAHGIAHRLLRWEGPKPSTGISAAAREARLALLAQAAREAGARFVLTGHTADDQAETLSMRLARGAGRGTAGMAPATLYDGDVWIVRPLLAVRRGALRAFLRERGIAWAEDPTNRDRRFERARVRQDLDEPAIRELIASARKAQAAREETGRSAASIVARAAERPVPGLLRLPLPAVRETAAGLYALRILLAVAGGTPHLPDEARTVAVLSRAGEGLRASLSRAVVTVSHGQLYLHRERRNLPAAALAGEVLWDGRYLVMAGEGTAGLVLAPYGRENAEEASLGDVDAPAGLLRSALATEPALWKNGDCLGLAGEAEGVSVRPVAGPWARLLPSFDSAPAGAVLDLLRGGPLPALPFHGHKEHMG
ncbi:tRNA lysidine(34) synthetase TilS [Chelativorans sp. AA-79]|uniref:tRNA lysidine(34) synthetase TilS n=1 Tax=Chelativorans sp. AA-79 TaxID=3028735 RepID=UPI0023F74E03|nr:tRNA lysidine(34) synthetase TilS [Chelativorans sp. AA-79]WEX10002.1 tRNA lysidine(34) synthetase TilS [Chelativorans sp. AA-79]